MLAKVEHNKENAAQAGLRLAYLVSQYPTVSHTFILREIRYLRQLGCDVHVISISSADRPPEKMTPEEADELGRTVYVKAIGLLGALGQQCAMLFTHPRSYVQGLYYALALAKLDLRKTIRCLFYFAEAVIVGRWMRREQLTHVHIHFSSTVGLIMRRMFPGTISMTLHGTDEFVDPVGFWLADKVAAASFVCAISSYGRSQIMYASPPAEWSKIEVAPLGIDPALFNPRAFRERPAPFEVFCVGRLVPVKAHHILLAAIELLVRAGRDVRLHLVGDGPSRAALESEVAARGLQACVVFEGWRNQDEVRVLYEQADAFALASFAEGVPVVLMEAMAMEIPCVATRITGIPELIRDGIEGLLVTPSDEAALAEALARLMDDAALRRRLGQAGRQRIIEKYNLARNSEHLAGIFRRRLAGTPAMWGGAPRAPEVAFTQTRATVPAESDGALDDSLAKV